MKRNLTLSFLLFTLFFSSLAQQKPSQQWLDQKFSMFIHFGLYSVYGGVYDGEPVRRGYSEQIQSFAGIFSDWYANTAQEFNPVKWNPDEIVQLAKDAACVPLFLHRSTTMGFACITQNILILTLLTPRLTSAI